MTDLPFPDHGVEARRVRSRLDVLSRRGGGVLAAPVGPWGEATVTGVRHRRLEVVPGLPADRRAAAVEDQIGPLIDRLRPGLVHVFGLPLAVPGVLRRRGGLRVVVEPGITPAQRLRDQRPDTPAVRLVDLVALEDNTLRHADAVIARSAVEAATLARRGVDCDRIWTVRDGLPDEATPAGPVGLPQLIYIGDLAPWSGWDTLLEALARLTVPWRLNVMLPAALNGQAVSARARALGIGERVRVVSQDASLPQRIAGAQAVVCPLLPLRSVVSGAVVPEGVLWALACGRPVVAADLPVVRAYAGAAARYFEAGDPGALATALGDLLESADLRGALGEAVAAQRERTRWAEAETLLGDLWSATLAGED